MLRITLLAALLAALGFQSPVRADHRDQRRDRDYGLERIEFGGYVESIRGQIAYVRDDCGTRYRVHLGPEWYWEERGWSMRSGCHVNFIAWQDPYDDFYYAGEIRGRGFYYDLCDSRGYPRWSERHYRDREWRPQRSFFDLHFHFGGPRYYSRHHWGHWGHGGHHGRGHGRCGP